MASDLECRKNNQYKESIEKYLTSILNDRESSASYYGLALSYKNLKNYKKAIFALKKAEKISPQDSSIQKELAMCNIIEGDFCNGIKHLVNSIKMEPNNTDIQMQLALVHEMIEEEDMALMIYQKIIETNPEYIRAYIQKATLYMHLEDYLNSAKMFSKVLKLKKDYYRAYLALGICMEKLGNSTGAKRYYKKYLKHNSNEEVINRISGLSSVNKKEEITLRIV